MYADIWQGEVDKIQYFSNQKARELEDDTVLVEGLTEVGGLLGKALEASQNEDLSDPTKENVIGHFMAGLEREMEEIRTETHALLEEDELDIPEREGIVTPEGPSESMPGFATLEDRAEYDRVIDSIESDEERQAMLDGLMYGFEQGAESIELTEQQELRVQQVEVLAVLLEAVISDIEGDEGGCVTKRLPGLPEVIKKWLIE